MAFTYVGDGSTSLDKARIELGDIDSTAPLYTDSELTYFLGVESTVMGAVLRAAEAAARRFARAYDFETDGQKFWRSQMATAMGSLAASLRDQGVVTSAGASGISTFASTRVDGYSQDIDSEEVSAAGTAFSPPRQRFYTVDGVDQVP